MWACWAKGMIRFTHTSEHFVILTFFLHQVSVVSQETCLNVFGCAGLSFYFWYFLLSCWDFVVFCMCVQTFLHTLSLNILLCFQSYYQNDRQRKIHLNAARTFCQMSAIHQSAGHWWNPLHWRGVKIAGWTCCSHSPHQYCSLSYIHWVILPLRCCNHHWEGLQPGALPTWFTVRSLIIANYI